MIREQAVHVLHQEREAGEGSVGESNIDLLVGRFSQVQDHGVDLGVHLLQAALGDVEEF